MLLDQIFYLQLAPCFLHDTPKRSTELQKSHDFTYMIALVVVITVLFRYHKREGVFDSLNTHTEIQQWHI